MTYREAIAHGEQVLTLAGIPDVKTDAWLLFEFAAKIDRNYYYRYREETVTEQTLSDYMSALKRRCERIPVQYIIGETEFMGLPFKVNSNVLIPRQDTETLVEEALKRVKPGMKVLDMCTGSGCILISLLHFAKDIKGYGSDLSKHAIHLAKENAKRNQVDAVFESGDLFDRITERFDMIVSNPPYIKTEEISRLMPEVRDFEPFAALDGKEDGLYFYRRIIKEALDHLLPNGMLLFEIGYDQGEEVSNLMKEAGFLNVKVIKDLALQDRVVIGGL